MYILGTTFFVFWLGLGRTLRCGMHNFLFVVLLIWIQASSIFWGNCPAESNKPHRIVFSKFL